MRRQMMSTMYNNIVYLPGLYTIFFGGLILIVLDFEVMFGKINRA